MKLPELEESLLRAARASLRPSAEERQRHEAALLARLEAPAASETGLRAPMRSETRQIMSPSGVVAKAAPGLGRGRLELLSAGIAVGMVFGGTLGFVLGRSEVGSARAGESQSSLEPRDPSGSARARAEASRTSAHDAATRALVPPGALAEVAEAAPVAEAPTPDTSITTRRLKPPRPRQHAKPKPESSLAIELSMLQRARRALGADNGRLALGIVQELEERFPKGVLMEERRATRVLSLCLLGRVDEARRFGSEFLAQHASSVYAERVRASCAATGR